MRSRKRSAASSGLLSGHTVFLDQSIGRVVVAGALGQLGIAVIAHDDVFPSDCTDAVWLQRAGEEGWIVLTRDKKIRYHASEKRALLAAGVRAFVLSSGNLTGPRMAEAVRKALPRMGALIASRRAAFIASITAGGIVRLLET